MEFHQSEKEGYSNKQSPASTMTNKSILVKFFFSHFAINKALLTDVPRRGYPPPVSSGYKFLTTNS